MKCVKLNLQERSKMKCNKPNIDKPRKFCQQRMVNPEHEEDPRWIDVYDRFYCNDYQSYDLNVTSSSQIQQCHEDLFLSVQNLQFQGTVDQHRKVRSSFKYKSLSNCHKHRMFVKQIVDECNQYSVTRSSELSDYVEDYTKYISNNDQSRSSSAKSSIVLFCLNNKRKQNKCVQVDIKSHETRKKPKIERGKRYQRAHPKSGLILKASDESVNTEDTKVAFHKNGKRKSLTISRTESPATVQVIRVDVVCNNSCSSSISDYDKSEKQYSHDLNQEDNKNQMNANQKSQLIKKYMLTNTVKTLEEKVSGSKVTLMLEVTRALANVTRPQRKDWYAMDHPARWGVCVPEFIGVRDGTSG
ncbi:unnamed protein product, partial [Brenthis ino]